MVRGAHGGEGLVDPHGVVWKMACRHRFLLLLVIEDCPGCLPGLGGVRYAAQGTRQWCHTPRVVHLAPIAVFAVLKDTV